MLMADAKPFWSALYHSLTLTDTEDYEYRRTEWPQFCDDTVTSADVRLSVGPNLSRAACQRPVDLSQSQAWTGGPSERKFALTSGLSSSASSRSRSINPLQK